MAKEPNTAAAGAIVAAQGHAGEPAASPPPAAVAPAKLGDTVLYVLDGGDVYPAMVIKAYPLIKGEPQAVDLHVFGRERHGMSFERVCVERGAPGEVARWSPRE
jgi:hypothetical protein